MSIDEWIKNMWYIYTVEYYSDIKKNAIMPFVTTWMDLEIIILSKSEKYKYHMISLICRFLKNDINELIYKTNTDLEIEFMINSGGGMGRDKFRVLD